MTQSIQPEDVDIEPFSRTLKKKNTFYFKLLLSLYLLFAKLYLAKNSTYNKAIALFTETQT